jgi:hypothetical protein
MMRSRPEKSKKFEENSKRIEENRRSQQLSAKEKYDERGRSDFFYFAHLWNNIMLFFAFFAAVDPFARHS